MYFDEGPRRWPGWARGGRDIFVIVVGFGDVMREVVIDG